MQNPINNCRDRLPLRSDMFRTMKIWFCKLYIKKMYNTSGVNYAKALIWTDHTLGFHPYVNSNVRATLHGIINSTTGRHCWNAHTLCDVIQGRYNHSYMPQCLILAEKRQPSYRNRIVFTGQQKYLNDIWTHDFRTENKRLFLTVFIYFKQELLDNSTICLLLL